MQPIDTFKLKDGREVEIVLPSMKGLKSLTAFINRLIAEDTFLNFTGEPTTIYFQRGYLKNLLIEIEKQKSAALWVTFRDKIIGSVDVRRGGPRDCHVGIIGLYIDKEFRRNGLGRYLLEKILARAKQMNLKIVSLNLFDENIAAKNLYEKFGFKEWARLPKGFFRQGKYSDAIKMYKDL